MNMKTTELPEFACLKCAEPLDCHSSPTFASPAPGDISVCLYCGNLAVFTRGCRGLRPPTKREVKEALSRPEMVRLIAGVHVSIWARKVGEQ